MLPCAWATAERWLGISKGTLLSILLEVSVTNQVNARMTKYLTIIPMRPKAKWAIDSEAMRVRGIIVLVKSN